MTTIEEILNNDELLLMDGFDDCIAGVAERCGMPMVFCYDYDKVIEKLIETGDCELIESSLIDSFWGWGPNKDGANHLGRVWMTLRDEFLGQNAETLSRAERVEQQ